MAGTTNDKKPTPGQKPTPGPKPTPKPTLVERLVGQFLLQRQLLAAGFLGGHEDLDLGQRERQKAQVLQQPAPSR